MPEHELDLTLCAHTQIEQLAQLKQLIVVELVVMQQQLQQLVLVFELVVEQL